MFDIASRITTQAARLPELVRSVDVMRRAGLFDPLRPHVGIRSLLLAKKWGPFVGTVRISAQRDPRALALADELGELTFTQLDRRSNALARAWQRRGVSERSVIAVLCRDHRGLVESMLAAAKTGARLLLMNTGFGAAALADVGEREGVDALVYDQEFTELVGSMPEHVERYLAWGDDAAAGRGAALATLDEMIASTADGDLPAPEQPGGFILLTSGTTGTPKGAPRQVTSPLSAAEFLDRIPLRVGEATLLGAPLFHGTGLSQFLLSFALGSTVVMHRKFDPEQALRDVERHRCTAMVLVPTMLQRIVALEPEVIARYDTSSLRIVFCAGSALQPDVGNRATELFGDVVYNLYGSTEIAVASVATPEDWRRAPGTAGRVPVGCRVRLYDEQNRRITRPGTTGRVFVGSGLSFGGYTSGGTKEMIDGLLSSGDVGHFDASGLLFIDGRDDDMIVSGGENVYPLEIENVLLEHDSVMDVAVVGVADQDFGQRLKAFVVRSAAGRARRGDTADEELAEELKDYVRSTLARFKVPREIVFLPDLPRNATGKLLRNKLG